MGELDPTWKTIATNIATKLASLTGVRSATADVPEAPPSMTPAVVVFPPEFVLDEAGATDVYEANFPVVSVLDAGNSWAVFTAQAYALIDQLVPAFHTGRRLSLPLIVINSHVRDMVPDVEITEWGEPVVPGLRFTIQVAVRVAAVRTD